MDGDLVGVWRLESCHEVDEHGGHQESPLGPDPAGLLFYGATGHVSVNMMSTRPGERATYQSYAGTWRRDGATVVHTITVAPESSWLGSEQVRQLVRDGDRLILTGRGPSGTPPRVLTWRRVT